MKHVETAHLAETGQNWPDWVDHYPDGVFNPEGVKVEGAAVDPNVGTWDDLVSGQHPLFPDGLDQYYDYMDDPFTIPYKLWRTRRRRIRRSVGMIGTMMIDDQREAGS